jgi:hypothetical protein
MYFRNMVGQCEDVDCIKLSEDKRPLQAFVNTVMNIRGPLTLIESFEGRPCTVRTAE